MQLIIKQQTGK